LITEEIKQAAEYIPSPKAALQTIAKAWPLQQAFSKRQLKRSRNQSQRWVGGLALANDEQCNHRRPYF
jgi:hypothetical protein